MTNTQLLGFAIAVCALLAILMWRLIRGEQGYGFFGNEDTAYSLVSALLGALSYTLFFASAMYLWIAVSKA